ncbi:putative FYVE zinc finger, Zinc finger, FYVE/PHD-type, Zinc finger, RING/FYVE/PHD-type [Plasmopara halstedii]
MRDELCEIDESRERHSNFRSSNGPISGQGRYVVPFTMSREEETIELEMARSQLRQLMDECAAPNTEAMNKSWTRVKSGKKSLGVILWERRSTREAKKNGWGGLSSMSQHDYIPMTYSIRSSTTVCAPVEMVLKTLDASVATAHRSFTRIIYGNLVADAAVLYHSSTPSPDPLAKNESDSMESLAVRWFVCRCSNPVVLNCDFCLQEYTKRHSIDELSLNSDYLNNNKLDNDDTVWGGNHQGLHPINEKPIAYKLFQSTENRHCPELLASHRIVRCNVPLGGYLLYPTNNSDKTDVVFFMTIAQDEINRNSASNNASCSDRQFRALQSVVRQMARQIGRLDNAVESYKLSLHLESLRSLQWVQNTERNECVVCFRRFHQLTRRKHHCRLCGEVICRDCSVHKDVDLPTCGLTALRICTSCNKVQRSKTPQAFVSSEKPRRRRGTINTSQIISYSYTETLETPVRHKSNTFRGKPNKFIVEKREKMLEERQPVEAVDAQKVHEQAASCPKPALEGDQCSKFWCDPRQKKASILTPGTSTANSASLPFGLPRSSSETFSAFPHSLSSHFTQQTKADLQSDDREDEDKFENLADSYNSGLELVWSSTSCRRHAVYDVKNGVLQPKSERNLKSMSHVTTNNQSQQDRLLIHREFESLKMYEDIFLRLCEHSASVRNSSFVALTLFAKSDKNQHNETESEFSTIQYLKARGRSTLIRVAANMRCCDPVLKLSKPIITRNTLALEGKLAVHPSGYDFRQLPIVMGPQQARFYAGVPLTDSKMRYRYGAIAIFDAASSTGMDNDLPMIKTLQALQVCVREAVMAVDERRKDLELRMFLQAPLIQLRQSEPALHLSMDIPKSNLDWQDIESLDGDDDKDDDDDSRSCIEYDTRNLKLRSSPGFQANGSSRVGKARAEHFRKKMQELVRQAQDTQAQMVENTLVMERQGVPIV